MSPYRNMSLSLARWTLIFQGCLTVLFACGADVRADHIDKELFKNALRIMKDLEEHGYKNVGILKFQVKRGSAKETLTAGKLNFLMATRLENALIMKDNAQSPIGITRGASAVAAAKDKKATFLTTAGKQKLFECKYPLAWGTQNVEVDAFLTGMVVIAPDMNKTTVTIQAFDRKDLEFRNIISFTVDTDIAILRDTNQNFVVTRRTSSWATSDDPEKELNDEAVHSAQTHNRVGVSRTLMVNDFRKDYLDFKIKFNDKVAEVTPDGFLSTPTAGQRVVIYLTAKVRLGLLLRINGVNTLDEERDEKSDLYAYRWWVLEPDKEYAIQGFYARGKVFDFIAKPAAAVAVTELGESSERHGKIDFDVFVEPASLVSGTINTKTRKPEFSFRTVNAQGASFSQVKAQIFKSMVPGKQPVGRTFITKNLNGRDQVLETTTFDGRHVGGLSVNYRRLEGGSSPPSSDS